MASSFTKTKILLFFTWLFALYSTWYLFLNNGAGDRLINIRDHHPLRLALLPGTSQEVKSSFTGLRIIDDQLALLTLTFWETLDGSMPHASLWAFMFAGQFAAAWVLVLIEGSRLSNRGKLITFTTIWGLLCQNAIYACTIPLYLILHLSTSPTACFTKPSDFLISIPSVNTIPLSLILGFVLPAITMALPAPSSLSYDQKQIAMAVWQIFPITIALLQFVFQSAISPPVTPVTSTRAQLHALRIAYASALLFAAIPRLAMTTLIATSTLFPALFAPEYKGVFAPSRVLTAAYITPSGKMSSIGEGNLQLLQYDEMVGAAALVFWAVSIYLHADKKERGWGRWIVLVARALGVWAFAGPLGVVVLCIWARDELVFGRVAEEGARKDT